LEEKRQDQDDDERSIEKDIHRVQTGSRAHSASYPMGTKSSFSGGKAAEV
jgi:hypothetical protein